MKYFLAALAAFSSSGAVAAVSAVQTVEKQVVETMPDGAVATRLVAAEKVAPGETVVYTLTYANDADAAAENVVLVMPVPEEVVFVEGSVSGDDSRVAFSADGGETYVARGRLVVEENGEARPATSDDITHIRWTVPSLAAKAKGEVSYRGVLK